MIDYLLSKHADFYIAPTRYTPAVSINTNEGLIKIKGRSVPEHSLAFYSPVFDVIQKLKPMGKQIKIIVELEYFNTSSAKCIFDLLKMSASKRTSGIRTEVIWRYEDDDLDMKETGEDYEELLGMDFIYESLDMEVSGNYKVSA